MVEYVPKQPCASKPKGVHNKHNQPCARADAFDDIIGTTSTCMATQKGTLPTSTGAPSNIGVSHSSCRLQSLLQLPERAPVIRQVTNSILTVCWAAGLEPEVAALLSQRCPSLLRLVSKTRQIVRTQSAFNSTLQRFLSVDVLSSMLCM